MTWFDLCFRKLILVLVWRMDLGIAFYILAWDFQTPASGALLGSLEKKSLTIIFIRWFLFCSIPKDSSCTRFLFCFICYEAILTTMLFIIMYLACAFNLFTFPFFLSTNQRFISMTIFPKIRYHTESHSVPFQIYGYHVNRTSVSLLLLSHFIWQFSVMSFTKCV